jgi:hypothetical protein
MSAQEFTRFCEDQGIVKGAVLVDLIDGDTFTVDLIHDGIVWCDYRAGRYGIDGTELHLYGLK